MNVELQTVSVNIEDVDQDLIVNSVLTLRLKYGVEGIEADSWFNLTTMKIYFVSYSCFILQEDVDATAGSQSYFMAA